MKSNKNSNSGSKPDGGRPQSSRSYSAAVSTASSAKNVPAGAPGLTNQRTSPSISEEGPMNQIHSLVRGLSKTDKDVHRSAFLHLIQSMIGKEVQVDMGDGSVLTGVLHTTSFPLKKQSDGGLFSQDFAKQVVLKACKVTQKGTSEKSFEAGATIFLDYSDVVAINATTVGDLHHRAVSADFRTDASIKKQDLSFLQGRELQSVADSWLDPSKATGLQAGGMKDWDQFETNRKLFDVKFSYDENLYTKKLDKSTFTPEQIAKAERLAREIEGQQSQNIHLLEERGLLDQNEIDEEAMYSGVIRQDYQPSIPNPPGKGNANGKARPPVPPVGNEAPWQRGMKFSEVANKRPAAAPTTATTASKGKESNTTTATTATPPSVPPATSAPDAQKDRLSPVRFGNFAESTSPKTGTTPTLEASMQKTSLEETTQKPLPALTPTNPKVLSTVSSRDSLAAGDRATPASLSGSLSNPSIADMAKTPTKEMGEEEKPKTTTSKLNPNASEWKFNVNAAEFKPSFATAPIVSATPSTTIASYSHSLPTTPSMYPSASTTPMSTNRTPATTSYSNAPSAQPVGLGYSPAAMPISTPSFDSPAAPRTPATTTASANAASVPMAKSSPGGTPMVTPAMTTSPSTIPMAGMSPQVAAGMNAGYPAQYAYAMGQTPGSMYPGNYYDSAAYTAYAQAAYYQQQQQQQMIAAYYQQQQATAYGGMYNGHMAMNPTAPTAMYSPGATSFIQVDAHGNQYNSITYSSGNSGGAAAVANTGMMYNNTATDPSQGGGGGRMNNPNNYGSGMKGGPRNRGMSGGGSSGGGGYNNNAGNKRGGGGGYTSGQAPVASSSTTATTTANSSQENTTSPSTHSNKEDPETSNH